jgi:hypothetical protein
MKSFLQFLDEKKDNEFKLVPQTKPVKTGRGHTVVAQTWTGPEKDKKGANILKHKDTNKFFAAGGSSSRESSRQFDTPEEAAKDYHNRL